MSVLSWNRYGKSRIRLVKVRRAGGVHDIVDLTVDVQLEGAFETVYTEGDNASCLATDTMKNTVYAIARRDPLDHIESFALRLADHFAARPPVSRARISLFEERWDRMPSAAGADPHAFVKGAGEQWTAEVIRDAGGAQVVSGLTNLVVMKTAGSAFSGFPRDEFTTLPETEDRLMATRLTAIWRYGSPDLDFDDTFSDVRNTLLEVFADHDSPSVQTSIWIMARAILERHDEVEEVRMVLPNLHHWLVDLSPFGMTNDGEVYVSTTEPHGLIEATVRRGAT